MAGEATNLASMLRKHLETVKLWLLKSCGGVHIQLLCIQGMASIYLLWIFVIIIMQLVAQTIEAMRRTPNATFSLSYLASVSKISMLACTTPRTALSHVGMLLSRSISNSFCISPCHFLFFFCTMYFLIFHSFFDSLHCGYALLDLDCILSPKLLYLQSSFFSFLS